MLSPIMDQDDSSKPSLTTRHRRTVSAPAQMEALAEAMSSSQKKYDDPNYIAQIYDKQARDFSAHLGWILEYKYKIQISGDWKQKVIDFYSKALKLNKLTENHPLDGITAINYFVRLLDAHEQMDIPNTPVPQREGLLYEWMIMSINLANKMNIDCAPWAADYAECLDEAYYAQYLDTLPNDAKAAFEQAGVRNHFKHAVADLKSKFELDNFSASVMLLVLSHQNQKSYLDPLMYTIKSVKGDIASNYLNSSLKKNIKSLRKEAITIVPQRELDELAQALPEDTYKLTLMAASMASKLNAKRPTVSKQYKYVRTQEKRLRKALEHLKSVPRMMTVDLTFEKKAKARLVQAERQALGALKFNLAILSSDDLLKDLYKKLNHSVKEAEFFDPQSTQYYAKLPISEPQQQAMLTLYQQKSSQILKTLVELSNKDQEDKRKSAPNTQGFNS